MIQSIQRTLGHTRPIIRSIDNYHLLKQNSKVYKTLEVSGWKEYAQGAAELGLSFWNIASLMVTLTFRILLVVINLDSEGVGMAVGFIYLLIFYYTRFSLY